MSKKEQELRRDIIEFTYTEDCIPRDHLLQQLDVAVNFGRLHDFIESKNCTVATPDARA